MIYGIDFDGTIVEEQFPAIGKPIEKTVDFIRKLQEKGHKWILITMREGKCLDDAVEWLKEQGLNPDAVNDNLPECVAKWGNNPRKVYADIYIDDHNAGGVRLPQLNKKPKEFNQEAFEKELGDLIRKHFNVEIIEELYGVYKMNPEWIAGVWGGALDCSVTIGWKVPVSEKEIRKYGKDFGRIRVEE